MDDSSRFNRNRTFEHRNRNHDDNRRNYERESRYEARRDVDINRPTMKLFDPAQVPRGRNYFEVSSRIDFLLFLS